MVDITIDKIKQVNKKGRRIMYGTAAVFTISSMIIFMLLQNSSGIQGGRKMVLFLFCAVFAALEAAAVIYSRKMLCSPGTPGNGAKVIEAASSLRYDFTSDRSAGMLYEKISRAGNYADKVILMLYLCGVHMFMGQTGEAVSLLSSVDRTEFENYPDAGMRFYSDAAGYYSDLGDNDSVLALYHGAESFVDRYAFRNCICCRAALDILAMTEKARGNYTKALDMLTMKNEIEDRSFSQTVLSGGNDPLGQFIKGIEISRTAEIAYLAGDIQRAAMWIDQGGPLLSPSGYYLQRANELSGKIGQAMSK